MLDPDERSQLVESFAGAEVLVAAHHRFKRVGGPCFEAGSAGPGPFAIQSAIAALHCQAWRAADTDWRQIVQLYDVLQQLQPSPIVDLNRAVAVAMRSRIGPMPQSVTGWRLSTRNFGSSVARTWKPLRPATPAGR